VSEETAHEEVVTSLLDLQAKLRGDGEDTGTQTAVHTDDPQDVIRVPDAGPIFVNLPEDPFETRRREPNVEPEPGSETEPLSVVESELTVAVEQHEPQEERQLEVISDKGGEFVAPVTPLHPASTLGADARLAALSERLSQLESELDGVIDRIANVDPARIDRLEAIHDELEVQQERLKAAIDSHFTELQRSISERLGSSES
jgi:hypothetical protein